MKLINKTFVSVYKYWLFSISKTNNSKLKLGVIFLYCLCFWKNEVLAQDRIYFNDTLVHGTFKIIGTKKIRFTPNNSYKTIRVPFKDIDSLVVVDEDKKEHIYKTITLLSARGGVYLQVKEQLVNGPMKLFTYETTGSAPAPGFGGFGGFGGNPGITFNISGGRSLTTLYIQHPNSDFAEPLELYRRFRKHKFIPWAKKYFAKCPKVLDAIAITYSSNVEKNLTHYVNLYNQNCMF